MTRAFGNFFMDSQVGKGFMPLPKYRLKLAMQHIKGT